MLKTCIHLIKKIVLRRYFFCCISSTLFCLYFELNSVKTKCDSINFSFFLQIHYIKCIQPANDYHFPISTCDQHNDTLTLKYTTAIFIWIRGNNITSSTELFFLTKNIFFLFFRFLRLFFQFHLKIFFSSNLNYIHVIMILIISIHLFLKELISLKWK